MSFNPEHFRRRYPGRPFPDIRFRPERLRWEDGRRLARRFGHVADAADDSPVWELFDRSGPLDVVGPASEAFYLSVLFGTYEIAARGRVVLDWYSGDQAEVDVRDVIDSFDGFWQAGVDDLALFDDSCEWILYFTRGGEVRLARADHDAKREPA